jgi:hypothetical protein
MRFVSVWHEATQGLVGGRADEPVKRAGPGDAMGVEGGGKASENAWFRVSERAVKIEYCRPAHHHVVSIARGQVPASDSCWPWAKCVWATSLMFGLSREDPSVFGVEGIT